MSAAAWAVRYIERSGLALTWLAPGQKKPTHDEWNKPENLIRTPEHAREHWSRYPRRGMGAVLAPSGKSSLDADNPERTRLVLAKLGIDFDALRARTTTVVGNPARCRLMFRAPDGLALPLKVLRWPRENDPTKCDTVFELRAGPVQDVLPPTIHPGTRKPYRWETPPRDGFTPLPDELLRLWQDWERTEEAGLSVCPWYEPPKESVNHVHRKPRNSDSPSVIEAFNAAHDVTALLKQHGYTRGGKRGERFLSPSSSTKVAGVVLLDGGAKCFFHNGSDPLADGHAHDAFDLYAQFDHGGDVRAAVREAARLLGLDRRAAT